VDDLNYDEVHRPDDNADAHDQRRRRARRVLVRNVV
jgi:hypothetical protein